MKRAAIVFAFIAPILQAIGQTVVWSSDFSIPAMWFAAHSGPVNLDWQVGVGLTNTGPFPTSPIQSTTAANGYAMLDSDGGPGSPGGPEESSYIEVGGIDLSATALPILRFQTHYRRAAPGHCYVEISNDGGATFPISHVLFIGLDDQDNTTNPLTVELDISSSVQPNPANVALRFHWIGPQGYSWFIDDIEITDGPPLPCNSEFIVSQATDGLGQPIPFMLNINYSLNGGTGPFTYAWDFGDGGTSTNPYPTHTYATNGPYDICLTIADAIGCTSTFCDSIMVDAGGMFSRNGFTIQVLPGISTGTEEIDEPSLHSIHPNPVGDVLQLTTTMRNSSDLALFTNVLGCTVLEAYPNNGRIDVSSLRSGPYILFVNGTAVRFVKE